MGKEVKIGQQDYSVVVFIPDPASTDGSGKTGLVAADLTVSGVRVESDNDVTVTDYTSSLNNLSALTDAHNDWGVKEVSSTLAPGLYRLDIADAMFLTGAWQAVVYVMITSSAAAASPIEFTLVPESPYSGVTATSVPSVTLANGAHGGAGATITLQTPISADLNTIKTQAVTCGSGVTILASVGTAATATAQSRDLTDAVLAAAIWNAATASYGSAGSYGLLLETDLDATISSRSTYAGGDTSGVTELLTRIPDATAGANGGLTICGSNAAATFASLACTGALTVSDGLIVSASTAGRDGASITGNTTGAGVKITGGATGNGLTLSGGETGGHGLSTTGVGTSYNGINAQGSATTGNGFKATGGGTGHGILAWSGSGATGNAIEAVAASTAGNGLYVAGTTTGHGLKISAGSTGNGIRVQTTAGDGISVAPTGGHALTLTGNGTSKHGLFATGGTAGTSDGIYAVAGTGGVPIRGTITGNLYGTVTTVTNLTNAPTNGDLTATMKASVTAAVPTTAEIKTAMEVDGGKLDHLWEMTEDDAGVRRLTENALEQAPSGTGASASAIADAVWDEAIADHTTGTTFGGKNQKVVPSETIDDYRVTGFSTHSAADVWSVGTRVLTAGTNIALAKGTGLTGLNDLSSSDITAAVPTAAAIKTALEVDGGKIDHLWEMTEDDAGVRRLTENALEMSPAGGGGVTLEGIWTYEDRSLTSPLVVLPAMQGTVYTATAVQSQTVRIVRNDTPRIVFDLGADYTGWTPWFGAKVRPGSSEYAIEPRAATWSDDSLGQGYIDLTGTDTADDGSYQAEIELRNGDSRLTAMRYTLAIIPDIIV